MSDTKIEMKMEEKIKPLAELCEKLVKMATAELEQNPSEVDTHEMYEVVDMIKDLSEAKEKTIECYYKMQIASAMEKSEDEYGETWDEDGRMYYRGQPRSKTSGRYMSRGDGRRNNYTEPIEYRMDMDLYKMNPNDLRRMDRMTGVHYYTDGGVNVAENVTPYSDAMVRGNNSSNNRMMYDGGSTMGASTNGGSMGGSTRSYDDGWNEGYSEGRRSGGGSTRLDRARKNYEEKGDMASFEEMMNAMKDELKELKPKMDENQKNMAKSKLTTMINTI